MTLEQIRERYDRMGWFWPDGSLSMEHLQKRYLPHEIRVFQLWIKGREPLEKIVNQYNTLQRELDKDNQDPGLRTMTPAYAEKLILEIQRWADRVLGYSSLRDRYERAA